MKRLFLFCAAFLMFASSFGQGSKSLTAACTSDCLLGDCRIRCPRSSVPSCTCIIGIFSSCKCLEEVMTRVAPAEYELTVKRNDELINSVSRFLAGKKDTAFSSAISKAYSALKENNQRDYETHLTTLENLVKSNPKLADDIYLFVQTLK